MRFFGAQFFSRWWVFGLPVLALQAFCLPALSAPIPVDQLMADHCPLNGQWRKLDKARSWGLVHRVGERKRLQAKPIALRQYRTVIKPQPQSSASATP